jgi:uncharacterized protein
MIKNRTIPVKRGTGRFFDVNIILLVGIFSFLTLSSAQALVVPQLQEYVNDYAGMISPSVRSKIEKDLRAFEESDSTQIVILTVLSLEGENIEEFGIKVAEAWKVRRQGKDNGVFFIVAKQERKIRIEVGRGLQGRVTDLTAGRIIDVAIKPKFKGGDFDGGFIAGTSSLIDAARVMSKAEGTHVPAVKQAPTRTSNKKDDQAAAACLGLSGTCLFVVVGIFVLNIAIMVWVVKDAKARGAGSPIGWLILVMLTGIVGLIIYYFSRPKGEIVKCPSCKNKRMQAMAKCPHCGN